MDSNNRILEAYIQFVITNGMAFDSGQVGTYTIRLGVDESSLTQENQSVYLSNKTTLINAIGDQGTDNNGEYSGSYGFVDGSRFSFSISNSGECTLSFGGSNTCMYGSDMGWYHPVCY